VLRHPAQRLAPLLDGSTAGELIPELVRHGLQQLIELEVAAVLGTDRYERSQECPWSPQRLPAQGAHHPGGQPNQAH
jgi:hypothetical protein